MTMIASDKFLVSEAAISIGAQNYPAIHLNGGWAQSYSRWFATDRDHLLDQPMHWVGFWDSRIKANQKAA